MHVSTCNGIRKLVAHVPVTLPFSRSVVMNVYTSTNITVGNKCGTKADRQAIYRNGKNNEQ